MNDKNLCATDPWYLYSLRQEIDQQITMLSQKTDRYNLVSNASKSLFAQIDVRFK